MKNPLKDKIENITVDELVGFWMDLILVLFLLTIPTIIFYYPVGKVFFICFVVLSPAFILAAISCSIISWVKKRKSLDKYPRIFD